MWFIPNYIEYKGIISTFCWIILIILLNIYFLIAVKFKAFSRKSASSDQIPGFFQAWKSISKFQDFSRIQGCVGTMSLQRYGRLRNYYSYPTNPISLRRKTSRYIEFNNNWRWPTNPNKRPSNARVLHCSS